LHGDHGVFIRSVQQKKKIKLTFFSRKHSRNVTSLCAPLHYRKDRAGLATGVEEGLGCYYLWDFGAERGNNFLNLSSSQIVSMELTEEAVHVEEFYCQSSVAKKPAKSPDV